MFSCTVQDFVNILFYQKYRLPPTWQYWHKEKPGWNRSPNLLFSVFVEFLARLDRRNFECQTWDLRLSQIPNSCCGVVVLTLCPDWPCLPSCPPLIYTRYQYTPTSVTNQDYVLYTKPVLTAMKSSQLLMPAERPELWKPKKRKASLELVPSSAELYLRLTTLRPLILNLKHLTSFASPSPTIKKVNNLFREEALLWGMNNWDRVHNCHLWALFNQVQNEEW